MENKHIIIILLIIIVVLASGIAVMLLNPATAKEPVKVKISSDKSQYEDDAELSIQLTDLNKTPISKEIVNITVTDSKGKVVVDDVVKTNSKGKAKLDLDLKKGKYKVNVTYGGNENYTGNKTTQKLVIKKEEVKTASISSTSSSSLPYSIDNLPPSNDPNPETKRYQIDEYTVVQEYSDNYRSTVDLRTGERHGGWI